MKISLEPAYAPLNLQQTTWTLSCQTLLIHPLPFCQPDQQPVVTGNQPIFQFSPTYDLMKNNNLLYLMSYLQLRHTFGNITNKISHQSLSVISQVKYCLSRLLLLGLLLQYHIRQHSQGSKKSNWIREGQGRPQACSRCSVEHGRRL